MTSALRCGICVAVVATLFQARTVWAVTPAGSAAMDAAGFVQKLTEEISKGLKAQAERLQEQKGGLERRRGAATGAERERLDAELQKVIGELNYVMSQEARAKGNATAWQVYKSINSFITTVAQIEGKLDQRDTWGPSIVDLDLMTAYRIGRARDMIQSAGQVVGYVGKVRALMETVEKLEKDAPTPQIRTMVVGLTGVLEGMKWVGAWCPVVSPMIEGYGKVGQALIRASVRLNTRLNAQHTGLFVDGRPNGGRLEAFDARFPEYAGTRATMNIIPLPGIRDAYLMPDGAIVAWDPTESRWHRRNMDPGEVIRRYAWLAAYGNPNPTPEQVLGSLASRRTIGVRVEARDRVILPGGSTKIRVHAERLDGVELEYVGIQLGAQVATSAIDVVRRDLMGMSSAAGSFSASIVDPGEIVRWTAPQAAHHVYRITASLPEAEGEYELVGPASCLVATGGSATVRATADPATVEPRGDGTIDYEVLNGQGQPIKPIGSITIIAPEELEVEAPRWRSETQAKGDAAYHAPREVGTYKVRVVFGGYVDAGFVYGENYVPAEAEVEVRVADAPPPPTPVVERPDTQEQNRIPGIYDGKNRYYMQLDYTVVVSGGPSGITWSMTTSRDGEVRNQYAGTLTPTGRTEGGGTELGGEYTRPGTGPPGWGRAWVRKDNDGNWVIGDLWLFGSRPTRPTSKYTRVSMKKRP